MLTVSVYDPKKDIQQVDQFGFVDLNNSIANGFVPNDLGSFEADFDGTDIDPESIVGKPSDRFEAMRLQEDLARGIKERSKSEKDESEKDKSEN